MLRRVVPPALALALLALATPAHAAELRYSITAKGGISSTGNTLGLAKQPAANGPGTGDSIGTFLSPDNQLFDDAPANPNNPWPAGTTFDWTLNGSSAVLELPESLSSGLEILYAELVWGGSYLYNTEDVSASLNTPVTIEANGMSQQVAPDPQTSVTLAEVASQGFAINYYMRSADVTSFVAEQLGGTYTVSGVPATQDVAIEQLNAAGWTLVVVYRDRALQTRNLTVFVGGQFVEEDALVDYPVSGFCTPPEGTVEGAAVISALEGDANRTGDIFQIGASVNGPFATLAGPNNPSDNFFASQINDVDGNLDTQGSAGNANHDAFAGINVVGGRQGWDVTKLPLSSAAGQLSPGQTSAVLRAITTGDSFMPVLAAFEIDVSSPDFEAVSSMIAEPTTIGIGGQSTITVDIVNGGEVGADALEFRVPLGAGLELISFAVDGNPQAVTTAALSSGVEVGDVAAGDGVTITMVVEAVDAPAIGNNWPISATWTYEYVSCVGEQPLTEQSFAFVNLAFLDGGDGDGDGDPGDGDGDGDGGVETGDDGGATGTDDGDGTGSDGGFGSLPREPEDGCNCDSNDSRSPAPLFALFGLIGLLRHRATRQSP